MKDKLKRVLLLIDRKSFPIHCGELADLEAILDKEMVEVDNYNTESPTEYFNRAIALTSDYELVVPVTRNLFVRDRLRQEGVNFVVCI